jgi:hypothetical protein
MSEWDAHAAREARHQARIEAAFDQADAHARAGSLEHALEWLPHIGGEGGEPLPPEESPTPDAVEEPRPAPVPA